MSAGDRLRRLRLGLGVVGLVMLLGLGLLIRGALSATVREQQLRREALAARVFDELEAALTGFVAREEGRPFVQWRREWIAPIDKAGTPGLTSSPLASVPDRAFVIGYFQIEPDGRFASPMLADADDPPSDPAVAARVERLRELTGDLVGDTPPLLAITNTDEQRQAPPQQQQRALPEDVQIQRALDQQAIVRQRKAGAEQNPTFAPDRDQLTNFLGPGNRLLDDPGLGEGGLDALDVRVTDFIVEDQGETLRMVRTVELGDQRWVQGSILDRRALEAWLEQEVLGSPELAGFVELAWAAERGSDPAAGRWTHRFAAPFAMLEATAELGRVHVLSSPGARVVLGLGIGLALALIVVLVTVEGRVAALLARAEERERFIAAVTHELRTPLTSIRMYSEMLEQGMVAEPERQRSYHGTIRGEAERLSRLVEQVLTLARLDEGQAALIGDERASLAAVVAGVVEILRPQAEARQLAIEVELAPNVANVELPRDALAQILTNLIDNAIKFTPIAGEPIQVVATGDAATLELHVRDHGPGVEAELLARMFEPFVRGRREHEDARPGTGIGLAVVESLTRALGGKVRARNRRGAGLEIEIALPLANAP